MKHVAASIHFSVMPSIGDFVDVEGEGTTGQSEILDVVDNNDGSHQVYFRVRFLEPFSNGSYSLVVSGISPADSHPAYFDSSAQVDDSDPDTRSGFVIVWF